MIEENKMKKEDVFELLDTNKDGVVNKVDNPNILNTQESYNMSNEILNDQITELKTSLEAAQAENKVLIDKLSEANVEKYEQSIAKLTEQSKADVEQIQSLKAELETSQSSISDLTSKLECVTENHEKLSVEVAEMHSVEKARLRKATLIEAGLSNAEAEAKLEAFEGLSDEQFTVLAETLASYAKTSDVQSSSDTTVEATDSTVSDDTIEHSEAKEASEEKVDEEVLETVQAEVASPLSVESDASTDSDDSFEGVRAGLQDWVQTVILRNKNSNSGE